jgi:pSer/pThr/pTyr-binding forkhead associated (FHA) protein
MARVQGSGVLELVVPDGWISEAHAELRRENSHWTVRDLGSKNSTLVDGERLQTADLPDQTLFQLGRTFFSFRSKLPVWGPPLTWKGRTCPGAQVGGTWPPRAPSKAFRRAAGRAGWELAARRSWEKRQRLGIPRPKLQA